MKRLDVITIGRSSVDLYGVQVGGFLEDMASFNKYIGGSPTNIAAGTARLGLKSALITRVGDEHMGRFIRNELQKEGVGAVLVAGVSALVGPFGGEGAVEAFDLAVGPGAVRFDEALLGTKAFHGFFELG